MVLSGREQPLRAAKECDAALIRRAQNNDHQAFAQLLREHDDDMRRLVYRVMRSASLIDDVLQDAYLKAFRSIGKFDQRSKFRTWLYTIVYRTCLDAIRYNDRRPVEPLSLIHDEPDPASRFDDQVVASSRIQYVLDRISPDQRVALLLVDREGLSFDEAAEVIDVPIGTVASRVARARAAVRKVLEVEEHHA